MPKRKLRAFEPSDTELLELLYEYNPWWQNKDIHIEKVQRGDFFKAKDRLTNNENDYTILALIGPRRVGKTILLYQLIKELLTTDTKNTNILFLSVDHPAIQLTSNLNKIFNIYQTNILKTAFNDLKEKIYIFLDEIQSFKNWELELKAFYDLKYKIKFVVTGSSGANIIEGASEALVGRIHPQIMLPIKFRDYLRFRITDPDKDSISEISRIGSKNMRNALQESLLNNQWKPFFNQIQIELKNLLPFKDKILAELNNYFLYGGYPQIVFNINNERAKEYLEDYISLTLDKDIRKLFKLKNTDALSNLFYLLCKSTPHLISKKELSSTLGIDRNTLNMYIYALKSTFLISEGYFFSRSTYNTLRKEKKIYTIDSGIRNLYAHSLSERIFADNKKIGDIAEIVVATHTNRLIFNLEGTTRNNRLYYWKEDGQGPEVDIVITPFSTILPIEVKYQTSIGRSDLDGLRKFNRKFRPDSNISLMVTKDEMDIINDSIIKIPAWLYLIMC